MNPGKDDSYKQETEKDKTTYDKKRVFLKNKENSGKLSAVRNESKKQTHIYFCLEPHLQGLIKIGGSLLRKTQEISQCITNSFKSTELFKKSMELF